MIIVSDRVSRALIQGLRHTVETTMMIMMLWLPLLLLKMKERMRNI